MKVAIPIYMVVPPMTPAQAKAMQAKVDGLLRRPDIRMLLVAQGLSFERLVVGEPIDVP